MAHSLCPKCNSPFITRIGTVGVLHKRDSQTFRCESCGATSTIKGGVTYLENLKV